MITKLFSKHGCSHITLSFQKEGQRTICCKNGKSYHLIFPNLIYISYYTPIFYKPYLFIYGTNYIPIKSLLAPASILHMPNMTTWGEVCLGRAEEDEFLDFNKFVKTLSPQDMHKELTSRFWNSYFDDFYFEPENVVMTTYIHNIYSKLKHRVGILPNSTLEL